MADEILTMEQLDTISDPKKDNISFNNKANVSSVYDMNEISRMYKYSIDTMRPKEVKKEGVLGSIGTFAKETLIGAGRPFEDMGNLMRETFDNHTMPNMTPEQANQLLEVAALDKQAQLIAKSYNDAMAGKRQTVMTGGNVVGSIIGMATVGALSGGSAILPGAITGLSEAQSFREKARLQELDESGNLQNFDSDSVDMASILHGALSGFIETKLGVEPAFTKGLAYLKTPLGARKIGQSALGEATEEALQEASNFFFSNSVDYEDRTYGELFQDMLENAMWGAIGGGVSGGALYKINRSRMIKTFKDSGLTDEQATQLTDIVLDETKDDILKEIFTNSQLMQKKGVAFDKLVDKIKEVYRNAGGIYTEEEIDKKADLDARMIASQIIHYADLQGIPTTDYLDVADIEIQDNQIKLVPTKYNDIKFIKEQKAKDNEEIKKLQEEVGKDNNKRITHLKNRVKILNSWEKKLNSEAKVKENKRAKTPYTESEKKIIKSYPRINVDNISGKEKDLLSQNDYNDTQREIITDGINLSSENKSPLQLIKTLTNSNDITSGAIAIASKLSKGSLELNNFINELFMRLDNRGERSEKDVIGEYLLESPLTSGYFDKDGTINGDSINHKMLKALFTEYIPSESVAEDTIEGQLDNEVLEQNDLAKENARLDDIYPEYKGETINIDGVEKSVYNSNGDRIAKSEQALRNFYKWFGDSKVVDDKGRPLVVYHGTSADFDTFANNSFFTDDYYNADGYAGGENVFEVYLKIEKPLIIDAQNKKWDKLNTKYGTTTQEVLKNVSDKDYDGVIFKNINDDWSDDAESENYTTDYIPIKPNQIKSTENRGTFSLEDNNIYMQGKKGNGFFDAKLKTIIIGSNYNSGTIPHEFAHFFLDKNFELYKSGQGTEAFNKEMKALFNILGIDENQDSITKDQQEMYAYMTEAYLFGKGVFRDDIKPAMQRFYDWIPAQYNNMQYISFKTSDGKVVQPVFNKQTIEYFDNLFAIVPNISEGKTAKTFTNTDEKIADKTIQQERTELLKNDVETREKTSDEIIEDLSPVESIDENYTPIEKPKKNIIQRLRFGRGTNTRAEMNTYADEFIDKHYNQALNIALGSPRIEDDDYVENDSGIDRGVLILRLMERFDKKSSQYTIMYKNFAIHRSLASKTAGLTNDVNTSYYLQGLKELAQATREKLALKMFGNRKNAINLLEKDVNSFIDNAVLKAIESENGKKALKQAIKERYGVDIEDDILFQDDIVKSTGFKYDKKDIRAIANRIKKRILGDNPTPEQSDKLANLSERAESSRQQIDDEDVKIAVQSANNMRNWREFIETEQPKPSTMGNILGNLFPRFMLSGPSTHLINLGSNAINKISLDSAMRTYYGANIVDNSLMNKEVERIKEIVNETGINLAMTEKGTDRALIHGEKFKIVPLREMKAYDPMRWLSWEDNLFRIREYTKALGYIASKNANGDKALANELFKRYKKINTTNEEDIKARREAILIGNMSVFTQGGKLSGMLSHIRAEIDKTFNIGTQSKPVGLGTVISPFLKTPATIVEMGARAISQPIKTIARQFNKEAKADIRDYADWSNTLWSIGIFVGTAFALGARYEEPYDFKKGKYNPSKPYDSIVFDNLGFALKLETFGAMAMPIRIMISAYTTQDVYTGFLSDTPLIKDIYSDISQAEQSPKNFAMRFAYGQANKVVPSVIRSGIKLGTREATDIDTGWKKGIGGTFSRAYGLDGQENNVNDYIKFIFRVLTISEK